MPLQRFTDIDELVENGRRLGFDGGGAQLKPTPLSVLRDFFSIGELTVVRQSGNSEIEFWGMTPENSFTFVVPLWREWYRINSANAAVTDLVVMPPNTEILIVTCAYDQFHVYVPLDLMSQYVGQSVYSLRQELSAVLCLPLQRYRMQVLRYLLLQAGKGESLGLELPLFQHQICKFLSGALRSEMNENPESIRMEKKKQVLRRTRDIIFSSLDSKISLSELSSAVHVSERTLQRVFKEEFQIGLRQYIKAHRLEQARQSLKKHIDHKSISDIATEHGYDHLGRFSSDFKQQFGLLPRDFLRNR